MYRQIRNLHIYLGRVVRDIRCKFASDELRQQIFADELQMRADCWYRKNRCDRLYSLHAPKVECISKDKAHKRYEFGVKANIAVTNRGNLVVGGLALPGNPNCH